MIDLTRREQTILGIVSLVVIVAAGVGISFFRTRNDPVGWWEKVRQTSFGNIWIYCVIISIIMKIIEQIILWW